MRIALLEIGFALSLVVNLVVGLILRRAWRLDRKWRR